VLLILILQMEYPSVLEVVPDEGKDAILMEITEVNTESRIERGDKKINFADMIQKIKPFCEGIIINFQTLSVKPNSASAEFGLKVSKKGDLFVAESAGESTIKISLTWNMK
jgi:NTP-dependent ternary system trypsin peptidase co-occuring protein